MIGISLDIPEVAARGPRISFPSFLPLVGGVPPTLFADFTTEGTTNQYWFNGLQQASFAAWNTAVGGTLTRASNATYTQGGVLKTATSGVMRFPSDSSSVPQGIRITGSISNNLKQSNTFTTTWTLVSGATPLQNVSGPDAGSNTGWTLTAAASVGTVLNQTVAIGAPSFVSVSAKAGTSNFIYISTTDAAGTKTTWFNASTGAVGTTNSTTSGTPTVVQTPATPVALANGWWEFGIANTSATTVSISIGQSDADAGTAATTGNTVLIYGAQLPNGGVIQGSVLLDYVPTTTVVATQAADNYAITRAFSAVQDTVMVKFTAPPQTNNTAGVFSLNDGSSNNRFDFRANTSGNTSIITSGGVLQLSEGWGGSVITANQQVKIAVALKAGTLAGFKNGLTMGTGAPTSMPVSLTTLTIGSVDGFAVPLYNNIQQIGIWSGVFAGTADLTALSTLP